MTTSSVGFAPMVSPLLADLFASHRTHLLSVAYRLTGSVGDAEEAVQESWLHLAGVHQSEIDELSVWLVGEVSGICLDHLRNAATRRETYAGQWLPEPIVSVAGRPRELDALVGADGSRLAAMVGLDALTPPQRVALVLHDMLGMAFDRIAEILGVSADAASEFVAQARSAEVAEPVAGDEHDRTLGRLLAALAADDPAAVVATVHPRASFTVDSGTETGVAVEGQQPVADLLIARWREHDLTPGLEFALVAVNGRSGLISLDPNSPFGRPVRILGFTVEDDMIRAVYDFANPRKLSGARP
ncbi:sigma factor [Nocardia lasii]|uniref:Sigma factor n=1 Tax=Nocardia lasii TaxID=1616107 RepID=A0ABW1JM98_9NOCA